jgi:predicted ATPase
MNAPGLQSVRLKNFKAVRDSGTITFSPLTVFIGNNGSGKSSIIEGLEMLHTIATKDLDAAISPWRDFNHILNQAMPHKLKKSLRSHERPHNENPMSFNLQGRLGDRNRINVSYVLEVAEGPASNDLFIKQETLEQKGRNVPKINFERNDAGRVSGKYTIDVEETVDAELQDGISLLNLSTARFPYDIPLRDFIQDWQFVSLVPQTMGNPKRQRRAIGRAKLEKDGSNIAEYLLEIYEKYKDAFVDIVSSLQLVLPYSTDLQIAVTSEIERSVYPQIAEGNFKVPGWLLSTGTLRILALLALLRHPEPPPLIIIEEIENGLDPRSVNLIIDEIKSAVESGKTQIIMTTHSPYLLDLVLLDHIVLVERIEGQPIFGRPADNEHLRQWAERFSLGTMYTMGKLAEKDEE